MIGAFVAAYFIGKRPVMQSLIFWFGLLITGFILAAYALGQGGLTGTIVNLLVGFAIFVLVSMIYLKVNLKTAVIMYIVSLCINLAIGVLSGVSFGLAESYIIQLMS